MIPILSGFVNDKKGFVELTARQTLFVSFQFSGFSFQFHPPRAMHAPPLIGRFQKKQGVALLLNTQIRICALKERDKSLFEKTY